MSRVEIRHFHLFAGLGGGARGFNAGHARVGQAETAFRCLGGVDSDPASMRDFERLSGAPGTTLDLFSREQYEAFHGQAPPADWREVTPADLRRAAGNERPNIIFTSPPCKGFSGLLSQKRSTGAKYQALNALTLRGIWLALEAWQDDPPEFFLLENVPRIANRGRPLLDQIEELLQAYGYATAETTHDCGELGELAQSRRRFLLVARHQEKVPPFLYEPPKRPLRAVGDVLRHFPVPGAAGGMHRLPSLQWRTWVRLALVEAGSDWRSLERLRVEDGMLADYGIVPEAEFYGGAYGVLGWGQASGTITAGAGNPARGRFSVADPRTGFSGEYGQYGVKGWAETAGAVSGKAGPGSGRYSVQDPRLGRTAHNNVYRVVEWDKHRPSVTGGGGPTAGGLGVADPRGGDWASGKYRVTAMDETAGAVMGASGTGNGAYAVADPRPDFQPHTHTNVYRIRPWDETAGTITGSGHPAGGAGCIADPRLPWGARRQHYQTGGHYGVLPWETASYAVAGAAKHDQGPWSVADPRDLPGAEDRGVYVIRALDGTWHRPFTTLELAALQGLVDPEEDLELDGRSDSAWRERIGNAVPSPAAAAIASVMGETLLLAWAGETFTLGMTPIWVRPLQVAAAVDSGQRREGV